MEKPARRDRKKRTPRVAFRGTLSPRTLRILLALNEFELLRSTWLFAFDGGESEGRFKNLLTYLYHETGFIDRPDKQRNTFNALNSPAIYRLTDKGKTYLISQGYEVHQTALKIGPFAHNLLASDVMADIKLAIDRTDGLRFITKQEILAGAPAKTRSSGNPFAIPVTISYEWPNGKEAEEKTSYVADGWFGIEYADGSRRYFALEINHGSNVRANNLKDASHLRKFLSLRALRRDHLFNSHLGLNAPVTALFVQTESDKTANSKDLLAELSAGKGSGYFAFKTIPTHQQTDRAPLPDGKTLTVPWERVGFDSFRIDQP